MTSQVLMNGILAGLTWGLVALGFTVVYSTARFLHAAYAATFLVCAYVGVSLSRVTGVPLVVCALGAVAAGAILGVAVEILVYRPLRRRGSPSLILFLASLAILIIVENTVALLFGSEIQVPPGRGDQKSLRLLAAQLTFVQAGTGIAALALFLFTWAFTRLSSVGKRMRAVACDPELASAVGIDERSTLTIAMLVGSALSGASGFLLVYDTSATPTMGFTVLLVGVTAAIAGGVGSIPGAMLGGLLVGIGQHVGAWFLAPEWQDAVVMVILLLFLLLRPQGFFGKPLRKVTA